MKNKVTAAALAFFLGGFGIQWFYLGDNTKGVISLLFFWTFIPAFIAMPHALILIVTPDEKFDEKYNA